MFKTAITGALLATASGMTQQEIQAKAHQQILKFTHPLEHNKQVINLMASKDSKLSSAKLSLSAAKVPARGVSKADTRALRGKGGKGKGKDKDDDEAGAPRYLQYEVGYCAGTEMDGVTLTEDRFFTSMQFTDNVCVNAIDEEGYAFSHKTTLTMSEDLKVANHWSFYVLHDCEQDMLVDEFTDTTANFGLDIPANGVCTSVGVENVGARVAITETSFGTDSLAGSKVEFFNANVNECMHAAMAGDLSGHDIIEIERPVYQTPSGPMSLCYMNEKGGDDDYYVADDDDDLLAVGGSHEYDLSSCGDSTTPVLRRLRYTTDDCSGTPDGVDEGESEFCLFDRDEEDLLAHSQSCFAPSV